MAYGGYFEWASGDTLDAADLMTYLMQQSVVIWDTATTRNNDANYTSSLKEGNLCYIQSADTLYYYDGSAWQALASVAYVDTAAGSEARKALLLSFMESN
jgi:hypothetical protein